MTATVDSAVTTCLGDMPPCTSYPEFLPYSTAVSDACCGDGTCVAGLPTKCSVACEEVLLPMQEECQDFLVTIGIDANIETAVATCLGAAGGAAGPGGGH
jgi:hypothetical protein